MGEERGSEDAGQEQRRSQTDHLERDAGHHDERGHRQRLPERIRQVADRQDAEVERDQMVDGDGARGRQTISPNAYDHGDPTS